MSIYDSEQAKLLEARLHELAYNEDYRLCPIIKRDISEMECYEFRMGCVDSAPYKYYSKYNYEEMHSICNRCKFNVI